MLTETRPKFLSTITLILTLLFIATFALAGCDLSRKLHGAETTFPGKISKSEKLSFRMNVQYKKNDATTLIDLECYRAKNESGQVEYAYIYSCPEAKYDSYKNVYADGKLYEIINVTTKSGTYYTKENVAVDDDGNILYHITQKVFLTSVAALISKAKKETLREESVYRYDVAVNEKSISLWYNSDVLVQLYAAFDGDDGETEEYTIVFSDYTFDRDLPSDTFRRPETYGITYVPSPISFEAWTEILTSFAGKLG